MVVLTKRMANLADIGTGHSALRFPRSTESPTRSPSKAQKAATLTLKKMFMSSPHLRGYDCSFAPAAQVNRKRLLQDASSRNECEDGTGAAQVLPCSVMVASDVRSGAVMRTVIALGPGTRSITLLVQ